jgi:hypothetical protein
MRCFIPPASFYLRSYVLGKVITLPSRSGLCCRTSRIRLGSILNQILGPIQRFPQCLKSVRIIAFAFFLDGGVPEAAHRRTQTLDRLVPEVQGFGQSMFQDFALCVECLPGRWRNLGFAKIREKGSYPLEGVPGTQSALL